MPLNGDIKTFSVSAIGRMIHAEKKTGVLQVTSGVYATSIFFKNGKIVFISDELTTDPSLTSFIKTNNMIRDADIQKSLEMAQATGQRLIAVLLNQGYISQNKLSNVLRHQFKEVLAKVLSWEEGYFNYSDGLSGYNQDVHLEIDPMRLMAEAQQWKEYRSLIPDDDVVFQIKAGNFKSDLLSSDSASQVRLLINGERSVAQIITETGLSRMAVYRALAALASQGAITREMRINGKAEPDHLNNDTIIKFYFNLLNALTTGLIAELGRLKAGSLLEKSLKSTPYYDRFFCVFQPEQDLATNLQQMQSHMQHQSNRILHQDLVKGFNLAVVNLIQAEYQLLGLRVAQNTVNRANAVLELTPPKQKVLARTLNTLLNQLGQDEDLLRGTKSLSETFYVAKEPPLDKRPPSPSALNNIKEASIIAFYSLILQMLTNDLEQEIGAKASDLLQEVVMNSEYYDKFLSQFDINSSIGSNVRRISDHIKTREHKLDKPIMVLAFQQVLLALLQSQNRLLGNKAVQLSLFKIKEHLASSDLKNYDPLADSFFAFLKNTGHLGGTS